MLTRMLVLTCEADLEVLREECSVLFRHSREHLDRLHSSPLLGEPSSGLCSLLERKTSLLRFLAMRIWKVTHVEA